MVDAHWPNLPADDFWRDRPVAQRASAVESACRAAMQILEGLPDREDRLRHIDPVPASTRALLRRLAATR